MESPTVVGEWYLRMVTKISSTKTENPTLVAEWYVCTVMKISSTKTKMPHEIFCHMQHYGLL